MGEKKYLELDEVVDSKVNSKLQYLKVENYPQLFAQYFLPTILFFLLGFFINIPKPQSVSKILPKKTVGIVDQNKSAIVEFNRRNYEKAIEIFNRVLQRAPENASAHSNLAMALFEIGQKKKAIRLLKKAEKLDPSDPDIYGNLASLYFKMKYFKSAEKYFYKSLGKDSKKPQTLFNFAVMLETQERWSSAIVYYKKFLNVSDNATLDKEVRQRIKILNSLSASVGQGRKW